jgi:DNA-directed RNA polymerase specialized sigma24 family protein
VVGGRRLDPADEQIVRRCYESLRRFAAVVGPPVAEPDDLVQEALVRTLRVTPLHQLDNPEAYLRRAVVNLARNARRSSRRRDAAFVRLAPVAGTADTHPSDLADLERLPARDRALLYLRVVEGRSYAEMASELAMREEAVRARVSRATRHLRVLIVEELRDG